MKTKQIAPWKWGRLPAETGQPFDMFRREMEAFHRSMTRMLDDMMQGWGGGGAAPWTWSNAGMMPSVAESEDEKGYFVTVELPGMDEKDVEVTLADGMLTIRGEKKLDKEEEGKDFFRSEHSYGTFRRVLAIPVEVDEAKIEATFCKGVLRITMPKTKEAQRKIHHIDVKAA
jgi:HSP20 family protein